MELRQLKCFIKAKEVPFNFVESFSQQRPVIGILFLSETSVNDPHVVGIPIEGKNMRRTIMIVSNYISLKLAFKKCRIMVSALPMCIIINSVLVLHYCEFSNGISF